MYAIRSYYVKENSEILQQNVITISSNSNQEAASLEETAAALEEITSTIVNNAENINQMSSHARELTTAVKQA